MQEGQDPGARAGAYHDTSFARKGGTPPPPLSPSGVRKENPILDKPLDTACLRGAYPSLTLYFIGAPGGI